MPRFKLSMRWLLNAKNNIVFILNTPTNKIHTKMHSQMNRFTLHSLSQTKPNPNQNGVGFFVRLVCRISRLSSADNYIVTNPLWYSVPVNYRCHPRNMLRTLTNPTTFSLDENQLNTVSIAVFHWFF